MSLNPTRVAISRSGWILYAIVEAALFATANVTANTSSHPGTVSNVCLIAFITGLVVALLLGAATLLRRTAH